MIRAAIVGLGRWGRSLVASVQGKSKDLRFVLAHTRTRATAEDFCRSQELALVDSYEQLLADSNVDAVVLATPHSLHESQIIAAAAAGKHVHVEKPITLDRAGADRAVNAARKAGVVLAVGYCRRFHPSVVGVRRRLAEGRLGALISIVAQHTTSTGQFIAPDNWRAAPEEAPGGALTAVGVHALDHMIEFAGRVRDVRCVTARNIPGPSDDTTTVMQTLRFVPTSEQAPTGPVTAPPDEISEHPGFDMLNAELTEFARAIRERRPYPVPIDEVLHGMSVFDAIVQAARSNEIVAVAGG